MKRPKGVRIIVSGRRYYLRLLVCGNRNQLFPFVAPPEDSAKLIPDYYAQFFNETKKAYVVTGEQLQSLTNFIVPSKLYEMNKEGTSYYKADIVSSDFNNSFVIFEKRG